MASAAIPSSSSLTADSHVVSLPLHCTRTFDQNSQVEVKPPSGFDRLNAIKERVQRAVGAEVEQATDQTPFTRILLAVTPLPVDLIHLIAEYRLSHHLPIWVSPSIGQKRSESDSFHSFDMADGDPLRSVLQDGWCVRAVVGLYDIGGCCGARFVYGPAHLPLSDEDIEQRRNCLSAWDDQSSGRDHPIGWTFCLHDDEYLQRLVIWSNGAAVQKIQFTTSLGRAFVIGRSSAGNKSEIMPPPNTAIIALTGHRGTNAHLHRIAAVFMATVRHPRITTSLLLGKTEKEEPTEKKA